MKKPPILAHFEDQGGIVVEGSRHLKLYDRTGRLLGILPTEGKSASETNRRQFLNLRAQLRRAGFRV